jgi:autotransporter-associated beta strand protein
MKRNQPKKRKVPSLFIPRRPERRTGYRPQFDLLEDRLAPATINLAGGVLTVTFDPGAAAAMSGTPTALTFDAGAGNTFTASNAAGFGTGGRMSGPGNLTTDGVTSIVIAGTPATFTINAGGAAAFPTFSVGAGVVSTLINNAAFSTGANAQTYNGPVTLSVSTNLTASVLTVSGATLALGTKTLTTTVSGVSSISAVIGGTGGLIAGGTGTLDLTGANTYTGATMITGGVLEIGNAGTTGSLSATTAITDNAALVYDRTDNISVGNTITGTGSLTQLGGGTLTLTSTGNTYSGGTIITSGILQDGAAGALPSGTSITFGGVGTNGTLDLDGQTQMVSGLAVAAGATAASQIITNSSSSPSVLTFAGGTSTFGGVIQDGSKPVGLFVKSGTLILTGANTFTNLTHIASTTTLQIGNGGTTGSLSATGSIVDDGSLIYDRSDNISIGYPITSTGSLTQAGGGILTLTNGGNTYSGGTNITSGTIQIGAAGALPSGTSITFGGAATNGTLDLNGQNLTVGGLDTSGAGTPASQIITNSSGTTNSTLTYSGGTSTFGGVIQDGTSTTALTVSAGTLTLSGANSYSGGTTINAAGTLQIGNGSTTGSLNAGVGITDNGTLIYNRSDSISIGNVFTGIATAILQQGGNGTLTLTGSSPLFVGTTTVSAGTLLVAGNSVIANSPVSVTGGTFGASGGSATVPSITATGGTVSPGDSAGTATLTTPGAASFNGADYLNDINGTNTDLLAATGIVSLTGSVLDIHTIAPGTVNVTMYTIMTAGSFGGTTFDNAPGTGSIVGDGAGNYYMVTYNTNSIVLECVPRPTLDVWTDDGGDDLFSNGKNWASGSAPQNGDTLVFNTANKNHNSGGNKFFTPIDDMAGLSNITVQIVEGATAARNFNLTNMGGATLTLAPTGITSTVNVANQTATVAIPLVLAGATSFTVNAGAAGSSLTVSGAISGSGPLNNNGAGTLILSGSNNYSGATQITSGTLSLGANNSLPNTTTVTVSGGTLDINTNSNTVAGVTLQSGSITGTSGTLTSTTNFAIQSGTITANLAGSVGLTKTTAGTVTMSGSDSYTGATAIQQGTLQLAASNVLPAATTIILGNGATNGTLDLAGFNQTVGGLSVAGTTVSSQLIGNSSTTNNSTLTFTGGTSTFTGIIEDALGGGTKQVALAVTAGTLILAGANTYSGGTTISGGTLQVGDGTAGHDGTLGTGVVKDGAALIFDPNGTITINNQITNNGATAGSVTQNGPGSTVLGNNTNNYSGGTTITAGILSVSADRDLGAVPGAATPANVVINGGTLQATTTFTLVANRGVALGPGTGTIDVTNNNVLTVAGIIADNGGAGTLIKTDSGTLALSGANTYSGGTTISLGVLQLQANNAVPGGTVAGDVIVNGTFDLNGFSDTINGLSGGGTIDDSAAGNSTLTVGGMNHGGTFSGQVKNTGTGKLALTKIGTGLLQLANSFNSYGGDTSIQGGVLQLGANNAVPGGSTTTGNLSISGGATFDLNGFVETINGFVAGSTGTIDNTAFFTTSGLTVGNTFTNPSSSFNGVLQSSGLLANLNLTTQGTGTLTLAGTAPNTYNGTTTVNPGGTLLLSKPADVVAVSGSLLSILNTATVRLTAADQINPGADVQLFGSATLDLNNFSDRIAALLDDMTGAATVNLGSGDLGLINGNASFSGNLIGTGRLILVGNGGSPDSTFGPAVSPDSFPTSDPHGLVVSNLGSADTTAGVVVVPAGQPGAGDSILVGTSVSGGVSRIVVQRFLPNGTIDATFGSGGTFVVPEPAAGTNDTATGVIYDTATGDVYISGYSTAGGANSAALWAVTATGSGLDTNFNNAGPNKGEFVLPLGAGAQFNALTLDPVSGNIVAVGTQSGPSKVIVARVTPTGTLDNTFNGGAPLVVNDPVASSADVVTSVVIETTGLRDIVIGGSSTVAGTPRAAVWFVKPNGSGLEPLNSAVASNGEVLELPAGLSGAQINALGLEQATGNIIAAGNALPVTTSSAALLMSITPAAALDGSFNGGTGVELPAISLNQIRALTMLNDGTGRFVVAGTTTVPVVPGDARNEFTNVALARFDSFGRIDQFFGSAKNGLEVLDSGHQADVATGLAMQANGDLLMSGQMSSADGGDAVLARFYDGLSNAAPVETLTPLAPYAGFTGALVVDGGTLNLPVTSVPTTTAVDVGPAGTLSLTGHDLEIGSLSGSGTVSLGRNNLTVGSNNANTDFYGVLGSFGDGGGVTKVGTGTLTYRGGQANNYTGPTTVLNGTLQLGKTVFVHSSPFGDAQDNNAIVGNLLVGSNSAGAPQAFVVDLAPQQLNDTATVFLATSGHFVFVNNDPTTEDATFPTQVTNTNDSGAGSLRQAIASAITLGGAAVTFAIPSGPFTIQLSSPLQPITVPIVIDGTTQPGFINTPLVTLSGTSAGSSAVGVTLLAGNSKVLGLGFTGFGGDVIRVQSSNDVVQGNIILNNHGNGIDVVSGTNTTIGGPAAANGNVIGGSTLDGVLVQAGATNTTIQNNLIGTDLAGDKLGNQGDGIQLQGGPNSVSSNVIAANGQQGLEIDGGFGNSILGNKIGTNADGTVGLGNAMNGIDLVNSSSNTISNNVISANVQQGVLIQGPHADNNQLLGNLIGTDRTGTQALGNSHDGIDIIGSAGDIIGGNTVSANGQNGIEIIGPNADGNTITDNFLGTSKGGTARLGNGGDGIDLEGSSGNQITSNVDGANLHGIVLHQANNNVIQGNDIGTDISGSIDLGNRSDGILLMDAAKNLIGVAPPETPSGFLNNLPQGVLPFPFGRNQIAFNGGNGVNIQGNSPDNAVLSNLIYSNDGSDHIGIELNGGGANHGISAPVLMTATTTGVTGTFSGAPNAQYLLQFFDPINDPEGQTLLGSMVITTDANGNATFTFTFALRVGMLITATATDSQGDTSAFSAGVIVTAPAVGIVDHPIRIDDPRGIIPQVILPPLPPLAALQPQELPLLAAFGLPDVNSLFDLQLQTPPDVTGFSVTALVDPANSGEVHGFVFEDLNDNGVRDAEEPGLKGQEIFLDAKGNENPVEGDPTAVTDEKGEFHFAGVPAGTYTIRRRLPKENDYMRSTTKDPYVIKVDPQGTVKDVGFGLIEVRRRRRRAGGQTELPRPAHELVPVAPIVEAPVGALCPPISTIAPVAPDRKQNETAPLTATPATPVPWAAWLLAGAVGTAAVASERPRAQRRTARRGFEMEELPGR